ncbi:hypothetical protein [Actinoplanes solisilvae]|uniref:hypothetical protein n=1 Tax=Actinoplanes solisilvae TaxID=2486853 RepID=UPI000FDBA2CA|nr:hypothetical protein [Actinoplanes solisilvae]
MTAYLVGGLRLLGTSAAAYFTSPLLLAIALVPAALRSFQMHSRNETGWLELPVEISRVVLITAMIALGRGWKLSSLADGNEWRQVGDDIAAAFRTEWFAIAVRMTVVTLLVLAFNAAVDSSARALLSEPDAAIFAVKNFVVIPLFLMVILRSLHAVD